MVDLVQEKTQIASQDGLAYAWGMGPNLQHEDDQCDKKQLEGQKVIDASVGGGGDIALFLHLTTETARK